MCGVPFRIYRNPVLGGAARVGDGGLPVPSPFNIYQLQLGGIERAFGATRHRWNRQYKAAQDIFGTELKCTAIRAMITTEHQVLYSDKFYSASGKGTLQNGEELLKLLGYGKDGSGRPVFFTYVLLDGVWRFSQTGT
eukprot:gene29278-65269_t